MSYDEMIQWLLEGEKKSQQLICKHPDQTYVEMEECGRTNRWNTLRALKVLNYFEGTRKVSLSVVAAIFISNLTAQVLTEKEYLNRPHFEVVTKTATYMYDQTGGGFSSIKDTNELEWIGYKPGKGKVPESAASDFRGLPNLVFRGDDNGAGHPGFEKCISTISGPNQITTRTRSGHWKWSWTFSDQGALLDITQTDSTRKYWFLYEGTPGGIFDPQGQFWGNNLDGKRSDSPPIGSELVGNGQWKWVFFGHKEVKNSLFIVHLTPDDHHDTFSYMGSSKKGIDSEDGMVVFGFGRKGSTPLMSGSNRFYIGMFYPIENNPMIFKELQQHFRSNVYNSPFNTEQ